MNIAILVIVALLLGSRSMPGGGIPPIDAGTGGGFGGCSQDRLLAMEIAKGKIRAKYPGVSYEDLPNTLLVLGYKFSYLNCPGSRDF